MKSTSPPTILDARVLSGSGGGPDKTLIYSPPFLANAGYRMLCAYLHDPADPGFDLLNKRAADVGTSLISIADRGPLDWRVVPRLLEVCRREQVRVWHGHDYKTNALGLVLRRFHPMRLVTTAHGWVHRTRRTPIYYAIDRLAMRYYEKVICVSDDLVRECRRIGVAPSKCLLLENGIDVTRFRRTQSKAQARQCLGFSEAFTIGAVGRLSAEKGFDILIRAVDRVLNTGLDVRLVIAGEGVERDSLARLIGELRREDRIRLLGHRADLIPLYESMDVYALSSYREGLPNVLLEAMAMEVPVVATRVNGVPRLITSGETGELVEAGAVDQMADALRRVLENAELSRRNADEGRRLVETRYSFAERMAKLARLYDSMNLNV
jgi:glycosyltransferase involved in cell wall biosynthesis